MPLKFIKSAFFFTLRDLKLLILERKFLLLKITSDYITERAVY